MCDADAGGVLIMATQEQRDAVRKVALAVKILNTALKAASDAAVFIELLILSEIGCRNRLYEIATSETREMILPSSENEAA